MVETKYGHLVKTMPYREGRGGANARQMTFMKGEDLGGFNLNFIIGVFDQVGDWAPNRGAHAHPFAECLFFFGHNTDDLSYLGAELTIDIGKEHEKHTFNVPTAISIPKGTPHFPIVCNKAEKPYRFVQIGLSAKYESLPAD